MHLTASSSSSCASSLPSAVFVLSVRNDLSVSSSWPRFRLRPRSVSSKSSSGSEESDALGVDLPDDVLLFLVLRSTRIDAPEELDD